MNHDKIEQLLNRFMNGETTLEEEHLLYDYFRHSDVPPQWQDYKEMFAFIEAGCPMPQPASSRRQLYRTLIGIAASLLVAVMFIWPREDSTKIATHMPITTAQTTCEPSAKEIEAQTKTIQPQLPQQHCNTPTKRRVRHKIIPAPIEEERIALVTEDVEQSNDVVESSQETNTVEPVVPTSPHHITTITEDTERPLSPDELLDLQLLLLDQRIAIMEAVGSSLLDQNERLVDCLYISDETIY